MTSQLFVRVQYPQPKSGNPINSVVLDRVLEDIRGCSSASNYDCALGARLTTDSQSGSKTSGAVVNFKSSPSRSAEPVDVKLLANSDQYYCKTACKGTKAAEVPKNGTPSILVEVYFNNNDSARTIYDITTAIKKAVKVHVATRIENPTGGDINICMMSFFMGKEGDDKSKLADVGPGPHRYPLYMSFDCCS